MVQRLVQRITSSRIPTRAGEFRLHLYHGDDGKDHLALVLGEVRDQPGVLVRIHSECLTGEVLGSLRCDCGQQLTKATELIAAEGRGVLIYMRQEGRGIGLRAKLETYNLQDQGYDTVDANLALGHQADEREYDIAAAMLIDLGVRSVRLLTNNPAKVESLEIHGIDDCERLPLEVPVHHENVRYLETKARRMRHTLRLSVVSAGGAAEPGAGNAPSLGFTDLEGSEPAENDRPAVLLTYAQSLDGSIAARRGEPLSLSGPQALRLTHTLRAQHEVILVGIETVLSDDPQLTVRYVEGPHPQPLVLDSKLRTPVDARLFRHPTRRPWIATTVGASRERQERLEKAGATVLRCGADEEGRVDLACLLTELSGRRVRTVMVEGGARVITSFLSARLVDRLVVTVVPVLVGGLSAVGPGVGTGASTLPALRNARSEWLGNDLVISADL